MEEKVKFKNFFNEELTGYWKIGRPGPVILLLHGFCGDKDEKGLFSQCAEHFSRYGLNTLRFDVSGTGESAGDFKQSSIRKQASDLNSAINYAKERYPHSPIGMVGFSLGATVALYSMNPNIKAYSFWSPAFFPAKDMFPRYDTLDNRVQLEQKGFINKDGHEVGKELLNDLEQFRSEKLLTCLASPVLIVHGTQDPRIPYASSVNAAKLLGCEHEVILIQGANHSYKDNEAHRQKVFEKAANWFCIHLK